MTKHTKAEQRKPQNTSHMVRRENIGFHNSQIVFVLLCFLQTVPPPTVFSHWVSRPHFYLVCGWVLRFGLAASTARLCALGDVGALRGFVAVVCACFGAAAAARARRLFLSGNAGWPRGSRAAAALRCICKGGDDGAVQRAGVCVCGGSCGSGSVVRCGCGCGA